VFENLFGQRFGGPGSSHDEAVTVGCHREPGVGRLLEETYDVHVPTSVSAAIEPPLSEPSKPSKPTKGGF
jgi:hypothetical protein